MTIIIIINNIIQGLYSTKSVPSVFVFVSANNLKGEASDRERKKIQFSRNL